MLLGAARCLEPIEDAKPFEARLEVRDDAAVWTTRDIEDRELEQVIELTRAGDTVRDIAEEKAEGMPQDMIDQEYYCKFIENATNFVR